MTTYSTIITSFGNPQNIIPSKIPHLMVITYSNYNAPMVCLCVRVLPESTHMYITDGT